MMQQCIFDYTWEPKGAAPEEITPPDQNPETLFHFLHNVGLDDIKAAAAAALRRQLNYSSTNLEISASSAYIPKQNQGDDAHFISAKNQTIGVADGVGGWARHGIDAGDYARSLMTNSVLALNRQSELQRVINPKAILGEAYKNTAAQGSSTACIVTLSGDRLRAANVGDSGFLVIRDGGVVFRSPTQQRCFNFPYQLGPTSDDPSVAEEMEVAVEAGDVVVVGTDGLWDNVHESEVVEIVTTKGKDEDDDDMEELASYMANAAVYNSFDKYGDSPFSIGARKAGQCHTGGKIDDITVIIARIHHQSTTQKTGDSDSDFTIIL